MVGEYGGQVGTCYQLRLMYDVWPLF